MSDAAGTSTAVCVLGMHRSGTSLVARLLNLLGVDLGPVEPLERAADDNPKGHWEHPEFVAINEQILFRFDGRWDILPAWPGDWPADPRLADLRERAARLVETCSAHPLWGWKDPRTCVTLPFWQSLIGRMSYVLCLRNPGAVAASLARRNAVGAEEADWLWRAYTLASLDGTAGAPRLIVFYEDLLADWPAECRRMAAFIGQPARTDEGAARDAASAFVEAELCHHRHTTDDLIADDRISLATKHLYVTLRHESARQHRSAASDVPTPGVASGPTSAAIAGQHERLAAEVVALHAEGERRSRELETAWSEAWAARHDLALAHQQIEAMHRSRAWRLASFLLRATGRVPATRRGNTGGDVPLA